jgi:GTP-binding protein HflX
VFVEDRLFATLDSATRQVDLGSGYTALVTDTVGFIRKLPHHLVASFRSTLEEAREADVLLHVIDASHPDWEEQGRVVDEVLDGLDLGDRPRVLVFNKVDRLTHAEVEALQQRVRAFAPTPAVFPSALETDGLASLVEALRTRARGRSPRVELEFPVAAGDLLAEIHREGEVLSQRDDGTKIRLIARLPESLLGRLRLDPQVVLASS